MSGKREKCLAEVFEVEKRKPRVAAHSEILLIANCSVLSTSVIPAAEKEVDKSSTYRDPGRTLMTLLTQAGERRDYKTQSSSQVVT